MIETTVYRRVPFDVHAVQVTEQNMADVAGWCKGKVMTAHGARYIKVDVHNTQPNDRLAKAFVGDFVVFAGRGFKVYLEKSFKASFEAVEGAPSVMHGPPVGSGVVASEEVVDAVATLSTPEDTPLPSLSEPIETRPVPTPPKKRPAQKPARVGNVGAALQDAQVQANLVNSSNAVPATPVVAAPTQVVTPVDETTNVVTTEPSA